MSGIVIEDEAWRRIFADEQLRRARSRLSFHEIRLIVQHVRDASVDTLPKGGDGEAGSVRSKGSAVPAEERADAPKTPPSESPL